MPTYRDIYKGTEWQAENLDELARMIAGPTGTWEEHIPELIFRGPPPERGIYLIDGPVDDSGTFFRRAHAFVKEV